MPDNPISLGLPGMHAPAFDSHNPPSSELVEDCVHCGFCLTTCPTYSLWGEEMDSPRGRIQLMRQGLEGDPLTDSMVGHFDACLGCMACVTSCPSGVRYDLLISRTRAQVERRHTRSRSQRLLLWFIFSLFPHPRRLHLLRAPIRAMQSLGVDKLLRRNRLFGRHLRSIAAMQSLAPRLAKAERLADITPADGTRRAVVGVLTGCVQREFFPEVNAATVRVLAAEGCDVIIPRRQGCCGALSAHSGREPEAQRYARALIDSFEDAGVDFVVVNAAGCGSSMKEYAELLGEDPVYGPRAELFAGRVRDFSEILVELGSVAERHPLEVSVAYHDACHLAHAQGIRQAPRDLLNAIPGIDVREVADAAVCCGSAGIYNILQPGPARELGDKKASDVKATGAALLVTANPGCMMQIAAALERSGEHMVLAHTAQVLDASIRGVQLGGS